MQSLFNINQKTNQWLSNSKIKAGYQSMSLLNRGKRNISQTKQNVSANKRLRFKTEHQEQINFKQGSQKARTSSHQLRNILRPKQVHSLRYQNDQALLDSSVSIQAYNVQQTIPIDEKLSKQWINASIPSLSPEALYEQNHQLKKECNFLKEQNTKLTSKLLMEKKQRDRLTKQLSLQEEYYNFYERYDLFDHSSVQASDINARAKYQTNNKYGFHPVNYMITGIKFRYEKLKEEYEKKCKEVEQMIRNTQIAQIQQISYHNKALKEENVRLMQKIYSLTNQISVVYEQKIQHNQNGQNSLKFFKRKATFQNQNINLMDAQSIKNLQNQNLMPLISADNSLNQDNLRLEESNILLNAKLQQNQSLLRDKSESIKKLQKSLLLLDNELHQRKKEISKLSKYQKEIKIKLKIIQKENVKIRQNSEKQMQNTKQLSQKMYEREKQIFVKEIQEKKEKISKLQKEISYLSTLLKYWKPLQNGQQLPKYRQQLPKYRQQLPKYQQASDKIQNIQILDSQQSNIVSKSPIRKRTMTKISQSNQKSVEDFKLGLKQPVLSLKVSQFQQSVSQESSQEYAYRQAKTSRKKHSRNGCKARKINPLEIQYMKDQIKYRCMVKRLTIQQIKQIFDFKEENKMALSNKQRVWGQKYITMKDLKQIFIQDPFRLTTEQSHKFSRFIVEDTSSEHVFCDQQNEIQREIVKSIIKAFIGDYCLSNIQKCRAELNKIQQIYGKNLRLALESLSDKGIISGFKMFGLIQSLAIEISQELKNEITARLYQKSQVYDRSINALRYEHMFEPDFLSK